MAKKEKVIDYTEAVKTIKSLIDRTTLKNSFEIVMKIKEELKKAEA